MDFAKILVVDDEPDHLSIICRWLDDEGHEVFASDNGWDALEALAQHQPALTVTDIQMRPMDGFQLIQRLREISNSYVLALTGLNGDESKIHGLDLGADEYLTKPISKRMFLARVHSLLRRANPTEEISTSYSDGCLTLDVLTRETRLHGGDLYLRPTEFRLLAYLCRNSDRVVRHEELLDRVWGEERGSLASLKWYVSSLRSKIKTISRGHDNILTIRHVGYRYLPSESCPEAFAAESQSSTGSKSLVLRPNPDIMATRVPAGTGPKGR